MGSFNVACSVSGLSIHPGENIIFIPLHENPYPYKIADGNHFLIYPWAFYSPATLPIFGVYGDYGRIEDIVRNENVERIEKHFNTTIDKICDPQTKGIRPICSGMFCLTEVYWELVENCLNDIGKVSVKRLYALGKYNDLRDALNPKPIKRIGGNEAANKIYGDLDAAMARLEFLDTQGGNIFGFREHPLLAEIYHPAIKEGEMKWELLDWARFEASFAACNKIYFPAQNGYQCGNPYMERVLLKKSLEIARRRR